jgi:hypothetical protein
MQPRSTHEIQVLSRWPACKDYFTPQSGPSLGSWNNHVGLCSLVQTPPHRTTELVAKTTTATPDCPSDAGLVSTQRPTGPAGVACIVHTLDETESKLSGQQWWRRWINKIMFPNIKTLFRDWLIPCTQFIARHCIGRITSSNPIFQNVCENIKKIFFLSEKMLLRDTFFRCGKCKL